jgi:signal peptidase I
MKKTAIILFSVFGFIFFTWVSLRLTNALNFYKIPTVSNQPTYNPGNIFFASVLKKPDRSNFLCFKIKGANTIYVFRCIAKGGDIVEIRDAMVYLNGKALDESYVWNEYYISPKDLNSIQGYIDTYKYPLYSINDSLSVISLSTADLRNYHLKLKPFVYSKGVVDSAIFEDFRRQKYNIDNFGPIKVPKDNYFLLGDNRHNAYDSRFMGFIKADQIVATVIR